MPTKIFTNDHILFIIMKTHKIEIVHKEKQTEKNVKLKQ